MDAAAGTLGLLRGAVEKKQRTQLPVCGLTTSEGS